METAASKLIVNLAKRSQVKSTGAMLEALKIFKADRSDEAARLAVLRLAGMKHDPVERKPKDGLAEILVDIAPEGLLEEIDSHVAGLKSQIVVAVEEIAEACRLVHRKRGQMTYTDLLVNLRDALVNVQTGNKLADVLRGNFKAALIDEFQDTDPVQYAIFKRVFLDDAGGRPVFFVGDPKQAIYAFRSGDIYTYRAAAEQVPAGGKYGLDLNFRSTPNMIAAINRIFGKAGIFGNGISYTPVKPGRNVQEMQDKLIKEPFVIPFYDLGIDDRKKSLPGKTHEIVKRIYDDMIDEIARLIDPAQECMIPDGPGNAMRSVQPKDIAILVMTHPDGERIQQKLTKRGIKSVRQGAGNVFESSEAHDLLLLADAMLAPRTPAIVRAAMITPLFPYTLEELAAFAGGAAVNRISGLERMEDWVDFMQELNNRWSSRSFMEAFNLLAGRIGARQTLLAREGGERSLTNILHLVELLHHEVRESRLGPAAMREWLAAQIDGATRVADESHELRLESDDDAVKIMTVYVSKGLEFPIVFLPVMWRNDPPTSGIAHNAYHPAAVPGAKETPLVISIDTDDKDARETARQENLDEDVRRLYVAATRGKYRTYLSWGLFLTQEQDDGGNGDSQEERLPSCALEKVLGLSVPAGLDNCMRVEQMLNSPARKNVSAGPASAGPAPLNPPGAASMATLRTECERSGVSPVVDKSHGHTSYSGLVAAGSHEAAPRGGEYDFDARDAAGVIEMPLSGDKLTIQSFPAGARTGECWHKIFEDLDFSADETAIRSLVEAQLAAFKLNRGGVADEVKEKNDVVTRMVCDTLAATLAPCGGTQFRLKDIGARDRLTEFEFQHPLPDLAHNTTDSIREAMEKHWPSRDAARRDLFAGRMRNMDRSIPQGFMTGFIDLLFRHDGRYYILDWKSNRCGGMFDQEGLDHEMAAHAYFIQYLIYTVAVNRYLAETVVGYDYDKHFGGIFYVFLRGTKADSAAGIYHDKPARGLVIRLDEILVGGVK